MTYMDNITKKVSEELARGWIGSNTQCPYHPSHFTGQDCTFCYCPFYPCNDTDMGKEITGRRGNKIWSCSECLFIHRTPVVKFVLSEIERMGITDPKDPLMKVIFTETKKKFFRMGKAIMVLGATSDAGKSVTVAALCRILHSKGHLVAPFKSQNMSLNSRVTRSGCEIAMIQVLQAQAAGLTNPDQHMNPILLKPKGNTVSQVIVEGVPVGDYDVKGYYNDFVPGPGIEAVRRNMDFLKRRYDYVVMEGAGSPAEINIYDCDIANMRAAEIADADCLLVVNVEWGGAFAYALGTVELMPPKDRARIKGIILNNIRGDTEKMRDGAKRLEEIIGIPVVGLIPHADVSLPTEDSESFRGMRSRGNGSIRVAVVKLPRIANFTDLDPLYLEDTTLEFVTDPEGLGCADLIVIPGTKNTIDDLQWLKERGMFDALKALRGKVPILGICGGYQMMGRVLSDPNGIEGRVPGDTEGLGFFDMVSEWKEYSKKVVQDSGTLIPTGEEVTGYELHMGTGIPNERHLFEIIRYPENESEGAVREEEMLFGTYLHGCLDKSGFRRYLLSFVKHEGKPVLQTGTVDYDSVVEKNLDILAESFRSGLDMEWFDRFSEGSQ